MPGRRGEHRPSRPSRPVADPGDSGRAPCRCFPGGMPGRMLALGPACPLGRAARGTEWRRGGGGSSPAQDRGTSTRRRPGPDRAVPCRADPGRPRSDSGPRLDRGPAEGRGLSARRRRLAGRVIRPSHSSESFVHFTRPRHSSESSIRVIRPGRPRPGGNNPAARPRMTDSDPTGACWRYGTREAVEKLAVCFVLNLAVCFALTLFQRSWSPALFGMKRFSVRRLFRPLGYSSAVSIFRFRLAFHRSQL